MGLQRVGHNVVNEQQYIILKHFKDICISVGKLFQIHLGYIYPKRYQSWIFTGRADAEAEAPILWPPDAKSRLIRKDPDAGKDWRQEKGETKDKMVGWHRQLNGHDSEQAPGDGEVQGILVCFSPWGGKKPDATKWLNNNIFPQCFPI